MKKGLIFVLTIGLLVGNVWGMKKREIKEEKELTPVGWLFTEGPVGLRLVTINNLSLKEIYLRIALVNKLCRDVTVEYKTWTGKRSIDITVSAKLLHDEEQIRALMNFLRATSKLGTLTIKLCSNGAIFDSVATKNFLKRLGEITHLKSLHLTGDVSQDAEDIAGDFLETIPGHIEELEISWCPKVEDSDLRFLQQCTKLKKVKLYELNNVIGNFCNYLPSSLEVLSFEGCHAMLPDVYLGNLLQRLPSIRQVTVIAFIDPLDRNTGSWLNCLPQNREVLLVLDSYKPLFEKSVIDRLKETHPWIARYFKFDEQTQMYVFQEKK